jgi:Transposase DDE domain group 1
MAFRLCEETETAKTKAAFLMTECKPKPIEFHTLGNREVVAHFDGGDITSDAGGLMLREVEQRTGILKKFGACFTDHRKPEAIEHPVEDLVAQRSYGLCLGYEDLNDHDALRADPILAVMVGKKDPKGEQRREERDRGKALAGKSTLNRLELTRADAGPEEKYKKIVMNPEAIDRLMVDHFMDAQPEAPLQIILDLDATDDPIHGHQEGRFFHGYYDCYCYLPLYIFCGEFLLSAQLRSASIDPAKGAFSDLKRVVAQIRAKWPRVHILVRGDSGFCRDAIMDWCERRGIDYVFGLAKNPRLLKEIQSELKAAEEESARTGEMARIFRNLRYRTLGETWSRTRRVVAKAEHLNQGSNPRFVVTSLPAHSFPAAVLYETIYCARGEMENRIKEQQMGLFADRTSTGTMRGNQLRLYFSSIAYILMHDLRRLALSGTDLERAQCTTIRLKLLKIGAQIHVTVRRVWIRMAAGYPYKQAFQQAFDNLQQIPLLC